MFERSELHREDAAMRLALLYTLEKLLMPSKTFMKFIANAVGVDDHGDP